MEKRLYLFVILLFLAVGAFLPAQTAAEIEEMLEINALNYEQAAGFVLKAADTNDSSGRLDLSTPAEAFRFAAEQKWLPKNAVPGGEARLDGVSLLLMRSFQIKGGLFYSMLKNPHYAYREMVYKDIIQGKSDPEMAVSGDLLLFLVSRILSLSEEDDIYGVEAEIQRIAADTAAKEEAERAIREHAAAEQARAAQRAEEQRVLAEEINSRLEAQDVADTNARITDEGVTISLSNIQFFANSAEMPESEREKLREIANILESIPMRKILVTGHTALAGNVQDRLRTSQERAQAVAAYLILLGTRKSDEVFSQGFGAERPVADNSTPQGMALNRRVEITILEDQ